MILGLALSVFLFTPCTAGALPAELCGRSLRATTATTCSCQNLQSMPHPAGVIWQGDGKNLRVSDIASMLAPALWFSAEEPLLVEHKTPIPRAHPCDSQSEKPVVYYQAHRINLRINSSVSEPLEEEPSLFSNVESIAIRYFFYYPEDIGMRSHVHDLEAAEFQVQLERTADGCDQVRLTDVIGFAHGVDWFYNHLRVEKDTKYPVMLLVEKGKHATCPDRNADGIYLSGYDVNQSTNDAWGIRDGWGTGSVLLSILLMGKGHTVSHSKPRDPAYRIFPPATSLACIAPESRSIDRTDSLPSYELRAANDVPQCNDAVDHRSSLFTMMRENRFGNQYPARQLTFESVHTLADKKSYTGFIPPISIRLDGDLGLSFLLPGWKYRQGYIVPKINWYGRETSFEALFTPTASQFFSWYATAGIDSNFRDDMRFVNEVGIKIRFRLEGKERHLMGVGYKFAGFRVGMRSIGIHHMRNQLLVEVGAGVW